MLVVERSDPLRWCSGCDPQPHDRSSRGRRNEVEVMMKRRTEQVLEPIEKASLKDAAGAAAGERQDTVGAGGTAVVGVGSTTHVAILSNPQVRIEALVFGSAAGSAEARLLFRSD
jgi:hypothetical protein